MVAATVLCFFGGLATLAAANPLMAPDPVSPAKWQATFNTDLPADPVTGGSPSTMHACVKLTSLDATHAMRA